MSDAALGGLERWAASRWLVVGPWLNTRAFVVDAVIAAAAGVSILASSAVRSGGVLASVLVSVASVALVVRRRWPLPVFAVTLVATAAYLLAGLPLGPIVQLPGFALYTVASWREPRVSVPAGATALVAGIGMSGAAPGGQVAWLVVVGWLLLPWLLGFVVRGYRRVREEIVSAQRRQAGYEERLAMAREVHDVVGHSLSVISMQSGAALHVLGSRPADAEQALRAIRAVSGQALRELRATLTADPGRLRGLGDVAEIVASSGGNGLTVQLEVEGARGDVPAAVDHAGFRIVQEALANVIRHARARTSSIRIAYAPNRIRLCVSDDGVGTAGREVLAGRGLIGMAERAKAVGGSVHAGPLSDRGFEVRAELSWDAP